MAPPLPDDLSRPGDICEDCRPFWEEQKLAPKRLVALTEATDKGVPIVVCPYCDGEPILRSAK